MVVDDPKNVPSSSKSIPTGHGRIIRDEAGNVIGVELNEEDEIEANTEGDAECTMEELEPGVDAIVLDKWATSLGGRNEVAGEKNTALLEGELLKYIHSATVRVAWVIHDSRVRRAG